MFFAPVRPRWAPGLLLSTLLAGCTVLPARLDLRDLPDDEALVAALDRIEDTYAFTDHKQLDWRAIRGEVLARPTLDDSVREIVAQLPDAHVRLANEDPSAALCATARASFGAQLSDVEDGRVLVVASEGGLSVGDEVLAVDGVPIEDARAEVPFRCFPFGAATHARRADVELRVLARGPVDGVRRWSVLRGGVVHEVETVAVEDTNDVQQAFRVPSPEVHVEHRRLPDGLGYIALRWEETYLTEVRFQRALRAVLDSDGLVLDLRNNDGGMERTAANVAGYFTQERAFYETVTFLDNRSGEQRVMSEVWTEPQELFYGRPVVVLVDGDTVSSGEGLAMLLARLPTVTVLGFEGTAASFGSTGSTVLFAGGWRLEYPGGRSLDVEGRIQLDSDASLEGGVVPDVVVPWTPENRIRYAAGEDVVLEHAVAHLRGVP